MSVSKVAKRRGEILDEIMRYHRERLPKVKREIPLADLRAFAAVAPPPRDFGASLRGPGVSLIAECKKASPSKGLMVPDYDPALLAKTYIAGGASAISVLTDKRHFQGSLADLQAVKVTVEESGKPQVSVLRKDFIFDPYQVYEARAAGADAVLLIVSVLSDAELGELLALAHSLDMQGLVEVHTAQEMARALALRARIVGVNNRNLQTFEVDFDNTARLRDIAPADVLLVGESGIRSAEDVRRMAEIGVDAILVGESLVRSSNTFDMVRTLVKAGQ